VDLLPHEAADVVLVQQMLTVSRENPAGITVVSDDTDVFVLLLHYYLENGITRLVTMESPIKGRVEKHQNIIPEILAGCDTVACCFGIGKNTVLKVVRSGISSSLLCHIDAPLPAVIEQATLFMTACYGQKCVKCLLNYMGWQHRQAGVKTKISLATSYH